MRLVEIPDDGIITQLIQYGDTAVGERRVDLSYLPVVKDVAPIIHAKWIPIVNISNPKEDMEKIGSKCSNCGGHGCYTDIYCKHCGALMED